MKPTQPFMTVKEIADLVEGRLTISAEEAARLRITGAAPFEAAGPDDITFAESADHVKRLQQTNAGAVLVSKPAATTAPVITVKNVRAAFARLLHRFYTPPPPADRIDPRASIGGGFTAGESVEIAPFVAVGDRVTVGSRIRLYPHVFLGDDVVLGDDVTIYPNVTILRGCKIGNRVTIHPGVVIGGDGFGFAKEGDTYLKVPQRGIVRIDDDVEIGAGTTIDRATFGETRIHSGVKTDNLVHIAHNVVVGENTLLVAQVGISGSVTIGRNATLAGQAGISGHLTIGDNAVIGPQSGVAKNVDSGQIVSGSPEMPHRRWLRIQRIIGQLPQWKQRLEALEARMPPAPPPEETKNEEG